MNKKINDTWSLVWSNDELYAIEIIPDKDKDNLGSISEVRYCNDNGGIQIYADDIDEYGYGVPIEVIEAVIQKSRELHSWTKQVLLCPKCKDYSFGPLCAYCEEDTLIDPGDYDEGLEENYLEYKK